MDESLGALVRRAREARGWTAKLLASKLGREQPWVSKLELDQLKETPSAHVLEGLERALGLPQERMLRSLGYLATESEEPRHGPLVDELVENAVHLDDEKITTLVEFSGYLLRKQAQTANEDRG